MATRTIICRDHGGRYTYEATRGRQPVRCKPDNPCDHASNETPIIRALPITPQREAKLQAQIAAYSPPKGKRGPVLETAQERKEARELAESNGAAPKTSNPSLTSAKAAKAQLEAVGWTVEGRAWVDASDDESNGLWVEIVASRQAETLLMQWHGGYLVQQDYSLNYERPVDNHIPPNKLGFDPEELTDRELVDRIRGMKVVWWNTLGNSTESGTVGNKVSVEHVFDDNTAKRLVKFVDHGGHGFRAFHVSALLKVG